MPITLSDIPALANIVRTTVESKEIHFLDATRPHIPDLEAFGRIIDRLRASAVMVFRWDASFEQNSSNKILSINNVRESAPLMMVTYKQNVLMINQELEIPNNNFHIMIENLLIPMQTCVSCMETMPNVIPCNTCFNSTYCDECLLNAMDTGHVNCPLCRCENYVIKSFLGSLGQHPTLFNKLKQRDNPAARELVQLLENYL